MFSIPQSTNLESSHEDLGVGGVKKGYAELGVMGIDEISYNLFVP
jgi:hypothetical protein